MRPVYYYAIPYFIFTYWLLDSIGNMYSFESCKYPIKYWNVITPSFHLLLITLLFIRDLCFEDDTYASKKKLIFAIFCSITALLHFFQIFAGTFWITESLAEKPDCVPMKYKVLDSIALPIQNLVSILRLQPYSMKFQVETCRLRNNQRLNLNTEAFYSRLYNSEQFNLTEEKKYFSTQFYMLELHEKEYEILYNNLTNPNVTLNLENTSNRNSLSQSNDKGLNCSICMGEYTYMEMVIELPKCRHRFHYDCLVKWLKLGHVTCPVCRRLIRKKLIEYMHDDTITSKDTSDAESVR